MKAAFKVLSRGIIPAALLLSTACASRPPRPADLELSGLSRSGRAAFERGDYKAAARFYRLARRRARLIDDPAEIATVTYNLAAVHLQTGEVERAGELLEEARRSFIRGPGVPADLSVLQARVALLQGRIGEAQGLIEEGLVAAGRGLAPEILTQLRVLRGRVALAAGDGEKAGKIVEELRRPMGKENNLLLRADYASLEAELLFSRGEYRAAAGLFDREAELLRRSARYRGMTRARVRAGEAWGSAGEPCLSGERFYRAARSLSARGESAAALERLQEALAAAEECPDEILREEVRGLFSELERTLGTVGPPGETE